jgi:hypothetical protein
MQGAVFELLRNNLLCRIGYVSQIGIDTTKRDHWHVSLPVGDTIKNISPKGIIKTIEMPRDSRAAHITECLWFPVGRTHIPYKLRYIPLNPNYTTITNIVNVDAINKIRKDAHIPTQVSNPKTLFVEMLEQSPEAYSDEVIWGIHSLVNKHPICSFTNQHFSPTYVQEEITHLANGIILGRPTSEAISQIFVNHIHPMIDIRSITTRSILGNNDTLSNLLSKMQNIRIDTSVHPISVPPYVIPHSKEYGASIALIDASRITDCKISYTIINGCICGTNIHYIVDRYGEYVGYSETSFSCNLSLLEDAARNISYIAYLRDTSMSTKEIVIDIQKSFNEEILVTISNKELQDMYAIYVDLSLLSLCNVGLATDG